MTMSFLDRHSLKNLREASEALTEDEFVIEWSVPDCGITFQP